MLAEKMTTRDGMEWKKRKENEDEALRYYSHSFSVVVYGGNCILGKRERIRDSVDRQTDRQCSRLQQQQQQSAIW